MNLYAGTVTDVKYIDDNGKEQTCATATVVENASSQVTWKAGWYLVKDADVVLSEGANCSGNVNLILADDAKLTATGLYSYGSAAINLGMSASITIYGQTAQTGKLIATGLEGCAGIGGGFSSPCGTINIFGGDITANGGSGASAIGPGMGTATVYVSPSLILKADGNNPPTTVIAADRTITTNIGSQLAGQRYATIEPSKAEPRDYLHFVGLNGNDTVRLDKIANSAKNLDKLAATFEYSKDRKTWTDYAWGTWTSTTKTALGNAIPLAKGDTVFFRAKGTDGKNATMSFNLYIYYNFVFGEDDSIAAGGNIMSLYDATCEQDTMTVYGFLYMFYKAKQLVSAPKLSTTKLADNCYYCMFTNCSALTQAPALPADTLAMSCYGSMFMGCTSLTTAPELPANVLAMNCYQHMFSGCISLTQAPALPVTTLAPYCYNSMFNGCTSLTTAPKLTANVLADNCYLKMFNGCTSLEVDTCLNDAQYEGALLVVPNPASAPANWNSNMFKGCKGDAKYTAQYGIQLGGHYCIKKYVPKTQITLAAEYGTYVSANTCTLPEGLKAYSCASISEQGVLQLEEDSVLRENTPYILKGTADSTYTCVITSTGTYTEPVKVGLLTGVYSNTTAPVGSYVLQNLSSVLGFYQVATGKQPTVGANHCYITLPAPTAKVLYFDETATGVESLSPALSSREGEMFNLQGMKVDANYKGIVIKNGKKYLNK